MPLRCHTQLLTLTLFDVGYRAEKHRKSRVHGTGFGLAVVKQNLDILKGTFGITSVLGQGTEIWVDISFKLSAS